MELENILWFLLFIGAVTLLVLYFFGVDFIVSVSTDIIQRLVLEVEKLVGTPFKSKP